MLVFGLCCISWAMGIEVYVWLKNLFWLTVKLVDVQISAACLVHVFEDEVHFSRSCKTGKKHPH